MRLLIILVLLAAMGWWSLQRMRRRADNVNRIPTETGLTVRRSPNAVQALVNGVNVPQRTALVQASVAGYPAWFSQVYDVQTVDGQSRRHYYPQLSVAVDWVGPSITIRRRGVIGWALGTSDGAEGAAPRRPVIRTSTVATRCASVPPPMRHRRAVSSPRWSDRYCAGNCWQPTRSSRCTRSTA